MYFYIADKGLNDYSSNLNNSLAQKSSGLSWFEALFDYFSQ